MQTENNNSQNDWRRLVSNSFFLVSFSFIVLIVFLAFFAYLLVPDKTPYANSQHLEIATRKPGFRVSMLKVKRNTTYEENSFFEKILKGHPDQYRYTAFTSLKLHKDSVFVVYAEPGYDEDGLLYGFHLADVFYAVDLLKGIKTDSDKCRFFDISRQSYNECDIPDLKERIEEEMIIERRYLLGTDRFGRDMLSRIILGARVSLGVGFIAVAISLLVGLLLGSMAGYFGGMADSLIMWFINVIWSIPTLLMVIALTMVIGKGFWQIFIAVGLTMWVEVARVVRGEVMSQRKLEYIDVARVSGLSHFRILYRHVLPNIISPVIIIAASNFATAILIEAGLSFLGTGIQPPVPSWGAMIRDHYGYIIVDKAYLALVPGTAIMLLVLSFTLIGNGLRDAFDIRGRN